MEIMSECAERLVNEVDSIELLSRFVAECVPYVIDSKRAFRFAYEEALRQRFGYDDIFASSLERLGNMSGMQFEPALDAGDRYEFAFQCVAIDIVEFLRTCVEKPGFYGPRFAFGSAADAASTVPFLAKLMLDKNALLWHGVGQTELTEDQRYVLMRALNADQVEGPVCEEKGASDQMENTCQVCKKAFSRNPKVESYGGRLCPSCYNSDPKARAYFRDIFYDESDFYLERIRQAEIALQVESKRMQQDGAASTSNKNGAGWQQFGSTKKPWYKRLLGG
jgi:hypothetical protein